MEKNIALFNFTQLCFASPVYLAALQEYLGVDQSAIDEKLAALDAGFEVTQAAVEKLIWLGRSLKPRFHMQYKKMLRHDGRYCYHRIVDSNICYQPVLYYENQLMPVSEFALDDGWTVDNQFRDEHYGALVTLLEKSGDNVPFEQIRVRLKAIGAHIEADEKRGTWLIALPFGENDPRVLVHPRHRGNASQELIQALREILRS